MFVFYHYQLLFLFEGVVGPEFSSEAEAISPILSSVHKERRLVQVGFSTTAARLGDNQKYPNFVRVVPNDNVQVEVCHFIFIQCLPLLLQVYVLQLVYSLY